MVGGITNLVVEYQVDQTNVVITGYEVIRFVWAFSGDGRRSATPAVLDAGQASELLHSLATGI